LRKKKASKKLAAGMSSLSQPYNKTAVSNSSDRQFYLWLLEIQMHFLKAARNKGTVFQIDLGKNCVTFGNLLDAQHLARFLVNDERIRKFSSFITRLVDDASTNYGAPKRDNFPESLNNMMGNMQQQQQQLQQQQQQQQQQQFASGFPGYPGYPAGASGMPAPGMPMSAGSPGMNPPFTFGSSTSTGMF
jgi:hypothetical protein